MNQRKISIKDVFKKSLKSDNIDEFISEESIRIGIPEKVLSHDMLDYFYNGNINEKEKTAFNWRLKSSKGTLMKTEVKRIAFYSFLKHKNLVDVAKNLKTNLDPNTLITDYNFIANDLEKRSFLYALYKSHSIKLECIFNIIDFKNNYYDFLEKVFDEEIIDENGKVKKVDIIDAMVDLDFSFEDFKIEYKWLPNKIKNKILLYFVNEGISIKNKDFYNKKEEIDKILNTEYIVNSYKVEKNENKKVLDYLKKHNVPQNEKMFKLVLNKALNKTLSDFEEKIQTNKIKKGKTDATKRRIS